MNPTYDFKNQVALVTGAASGMGRVTAKAFATASAATVLVDLDQTKLGRLAQGITDAGGKALALAGDVSEENFAKSVVVRQSPSSGGWTWRTTMPESSGPICPLTEETAEGYDAVNAVNLRGIWTFLKRKIFRFDAKPTADPVW